MIFDFPQDLQRGVNRAECVPVVHDDPVRVFLDNSFPHFCQVLSSFTPNMLPHYMLFVNVFNKVTGGFYLHPIEQLPKNNRHEPVPPVFVYRKRKRVAECLERYFVAGHHRFIMSVFENQPRDVPIHFVANDQYRDVYVSSFVYKEVIVQTDTNCVPLLVISTEEASIVFAETVCDLLHCTELDSALQVLRQRSDLLDTGLSVTSMRKLYDCLPPAYFRIPEYVWEFFRHIDIPPRLQE